MTPLPLRDRYAPPPSRAEDAAGAGGKPPASLDDVRSYFELNVGAYHLLGVKYELLAPKGQIQGYLAHKKQPPPP